MRRPDFEHGGRHFGPEMRFGGHGPHFGAGRFQHGPHFGPGRFGFRPPFGPWVWRRRFGFPFGRLFGGFGPSGRPGFGPGFRSGFGPGGARRGPGFGPGAEVRLDGAIAHLERTEARLKQRLEHVSRRIEELRAKRARRAEEQPSQQSAHTTNEQVTWL